MAKKNNGAHSAKGEKMGRKKHEVEEIEADVAEQGQEMSEEDRAAEEAAAADRMAKKIERLKAMDPIERGHRIDAYSFLALDPTTGQDRSPKMEDTWESYKVFCLFKKDADPLYWQAEADEALKPRASKTLSVGALAAQLVIALQAQKALGQQQDPAVAAALAELKALGL